MQRQRIAIAAGVLILGYFVLLGEVGQREPHLLILVLSALAAGSLILIYVVNVAARADRIDRGVLLGVLLFAAAGALAQFPRQAFDAVLAALLYAAAFWVARSLLAIEPGRKALLGVLIGLSACLTFVTAARWLLPALEWWSLTGWSVIPPLDLNLSANPWGHRHDLTLLLVMLFPSWWMGRLAPLRVGLATVVGIATLLIVLLDGSRNLWLAIAVASALVAAPVAVRRWPRNRTRRIAVGLGLLAVVGLVAVTGVGGSILQRLVTGGPIAARLAMWESLTDAWLAKPIAGYGPGSFPWVLQLTDYFDTNSWAPRHPDSVVFQLLPEAGLLGVAALLVTCVTLVPAVFRGRSRTALWVLTIFALAGLAAQPTDFGFLVAVAIGWAAFAAPRDELPAVPASTGLGGRARAVRLASLSCIALIAAAWIATAAAGLEYGSARAAIADGRLAEAIPRLELAMRLDPGMALYPRQLGTAQLLTGDARAATRSLNAAVAMNPADDLALRVLALAEGAAGDATSARVALAGAVERQRSDATNLLLQAQSQNSDANHDKAAATLAEIVQEWPEVVAAPGWSDQLPPRVSSQDLIELAIDRWSEAPLIPGILPLQPLLLAVMAGRVDAAQAMAEDLGASLGAAYVAVMSCEPSARNLLDHATDQARRSSLYWSLVVRQARLEGRVDVIAERLLEIMTNAPLLPAAARLTWNPLDENGLGGFSADRWGYRRSPVTWPSYRPLPSPEAGAVAWLLEPRGSVHRAGLVHTLPACR